MPGTKRRRTGSNIGAMQVYNTPGSAGRASTYIGRRARGYVRVGGYYGRFNRRTKRGGKGYVNLPELKFFDVALGSTNISSGGNITSNSLNLVRQGNSENQMIGRRITIRRISIKMSVKWITGASVTLSNVNAASTTRVMLIQDTQANGAGATPALVLEAVNYLGFMNLENKTRFKLLKEWIFTRNSTVGSDTTNYFVGPATSFVKWSKKCNIPIEFAPEAVAGTRAITEVRSNNLFILCFNEVTNESNIEYVTRIRYSDE